jgi:hypothetical protein
LAVLREEDPPEGSQAAERMLLTDVPITSKEDALWRVCWCAARWGIEVFHRALETGCQLEDWQPGYAVRRENGLAIDMVVAWRVYHLSMLGRMVAGARRRPDLRLGACLEVERFEAQSPGGLLQPRVHHASWRVF